MKLVVHELTGAGLVQEIIPTANVLVEAIRPHIYRHNFASGSLKVQVLDSMNIVLAESAAININTIGTQDYFHGYVRFLVNVGMKEGLTYKVKLVGQGGYAFSEGTYIGWCNDYDLSKYDASYNPTDNLQRPLDMEIWQRKNV